MKLYSAISALTGATGNRIKDAVLKISGFLSHQLERAGVPGAASLSLRWNREMMNQLLLLAGDSSPYELFLGERSRAEADLELLSYLESTEGFMEQDIFHAWRQAALPSLLNCSIEIVLVSGNNLKRASEIAETATNAVEFLGYSSAMISGVM